MFFRATKILTLLFLLFLSSYCIDVYAQTYTTITDGTWTDGTSWNGGTYPSYSDNWNGGERNAIITNNLVLGSGSDDIIINGYWNSITVDNEATLTVNVASLSFQDNYFSWFTNLTVTDGTLIINGNLNFANGAEFNIEGNGSVVINGDLSGTGNGGLFNVASGGSLDVNGTITLEGSNSTLSNSGTLEADNFIVRGGNTNFSTDGTVDIIDDLTIEGSGSLNVDDGVVSVGGDFTNDGGATTTIDGFLNVAGNVYNNDDIFGTGGLGWGGNYIPGNGSTIENVDQEATVPPFNPYDLATGGLFDNSVLPIKLIFFKGSVAGDFVQLNWATSEEENFDYFSVERSIDGVEFESVGKVYSSGKNTKVRQDYLFFDKQPHAGTTYYRLKAVDFDGSYEYFKAIYVNVDFAASSNLASIYPNPGNGNQLNVAFNETVDHPVKIRLYDYSGAVILERVIQSKSSTLNFENTLSKGMYILSLESAHQSRTLKWMVK